jgi:magnesium chelatase family protein
MIGPPGAGKSLMASCLPGILPELTPAEALEVSMVASVAGLLEDGRISRARPFRCPHHSASMAALTGGGLRVRPGEVSLAHLGVLFLDELPEFQRAVLDSLRQPLEAGEVSVARANAHVTFPARVQLVAAMNPCRCGHLGDPALGCSRAPKCAADYQSKVSGPLLDRIDLHVEVDPVSAADLALPPPAEGSDEVAARVAGARAIQTARLAGSGRRNNAELDGELLDRHATRTSRAAGCCCRRRKRCACRRGAIPGCCVWRARSPISAARRRSAASTSPKRSVIAAWRRARDVLKLDDRPNLRQLSSRWRLSGGAAGCADWDETGFGHR